MSRVSFFIDGFNVYHALAGRRQFNIYKWLNYHALAKHFLKSQETLGDIYYFTALATWNPGKVLKHQHYIKALESFNVQIVMGNFKRRTKKCRARDGCGMTFNTFEEKKTDVNVAVCMVRDAALHKYDKAIVITGDSDIIPAVQTVQRSFLKEVGVIIPVTRQAEELKQVCDFHYKMKELHLRANQLPDPVDCGLHGQIHKPSSWK